MSWKLVKRTFHGAKIQNSPHLYHFFQIYFPFLGGFCPRGHLVDYHLPNMDNRGHLANYHLPHFVHVVIEQPLIYPMLQPRTNKP